MTPKTTSEALEREQFEAWRRRTTKMDPDSSVALHGFGDDAPYQNEFTRMAWSAWKARGALLGGGEEQLLDAMNDMLNGWKYIRSFHGDLYGVGWDRAQEKMEKAIAALHPPGDQPATAGAEPTEARRLLTDAIPYRLGLIENSSSRAAAQVNCERIREMLAMVLADLADSAKPAGEPFFSDETSRLIEEVGALQIADNVFQGTRDDFLRFAAIAAAPAPSPEPGLRSLLEDWVTAFADSIEGGEADPLVKATREALATTKPEPASEDTGRASFYQGGGSHD